MNLTIDASVAVKWFVEEPRHEQARRALDRHHVLLAPDLILVEVANALRNKVRLRRAELSAMQKALAGLPAMFNRLTAPRDVLARAFDIACRINHPVADCVYLACAMESGAALLTDDEALFKKATSLAGSAKVLLLGDWAPETPAEHGE